LDVLACLYRKGEATAAEIRDHLVERRPMAHGSVLTLLKRLGAKGLVSRQKAAKGKAFVYQATDRPEIFHRRILKDLVDRVFGGDCIAMVASLLDTRSPTTEELAEMKRLLDQFSSRDRGGEEDS
jgi:predicted transcriptional regulator